MSLIRTQVQFYDEQHKWLRLQAANEGVSLSQLLRDMVDMYRMQLEKKKDLNRKKSNALSVVGRFSSQSGEETQPRK